MDSRVLESNSYHLYFHTGLIILISLEIIFILSLITFVVLEVIGGKRILDSCRTITPWFSNLNSSLFKPIFLEFLISQELINI